MVPRELCWTLIFPLFVVILSSLLIFSYSRQLRLQKNKKYEFYNKTVLVITAHPDDECMFFSPSILKLSRFCTVHVLCLSTGMPAYIIRVKTEVYILRFPSVAISFKCNTTHLSPPPNTPHPKVSRFFSFNFTPRDLGQSSPGKPDFVHIMAFLFNYR